MKGDPILILTAAILIATGYSIASSRDLLVVDDASVLGVHHHTLKKDVAPENSNAS